MEKNQFREETIKQYLTYPKEILAYKLLELEFELFTVKMKYDKNYNKMIKSMTKEINEKIRRETWHTENQ